MADAIAPCELAAFSTVRLGEAVKDIFNSIPEVPKESPRITHNRQGDFVHNERRSS